ncbi:MAG: site-specific integrase [Ilumatobacter sp.]|uniref:tyrosine-type recombinase/integrase n=1 Tax=Ilumatobacter sp. TaxID=1967498 RepID=UPI00329A04E3
MSWSPEFQRADRAGGEVDVRLGHPVVDRYLEFLAARCRPNTVLAAGFDLKVFFTLVPVEPTQVTTADVLAFITAQRASGDDTVVRLVDGEPELSARTIQRRLSSLSSMFAYLIVRGDIDQNPVPRRLSTRRSRDRGQRGVPLIRTPRTLPRVAEPAEVDALLWACRRWRDRAMIEAMVLGGLRRRLRLNRLGRCVGSGWVLGLSLADGTDRSSRLRARRVEPGRVRIGCVGG